MKYCREPEVNKELEDIAKQLVERRRARCKGSEWEFFSTGTLYRCVLSPCNKPQKQYRTRQALQKHLRAVHSSSYDPDDRAAEEELFKRGRCT